MKKVILSGGLILLFILYGLHQRQEDSNVQVTPPKLAVQSSSTPNPISSPTPTPTTDTPVDTSTSTPVPTTTPRAKYKDGTFTGPVADAYYGNVQVAAHISGGKIVSIDFLQYPNDRSTSVKINTQAMPYLQQEAVQAQSAQVDAVSGASDTSMAFIQSLSSALSQAK
jgi:uncharacterized protein with FMN-binding domain